MPHMTHSFHGRRLSKIVVGVAFASMLAACGSSAGAGDATSAGPDGSAPSDAQATGEPSSAQATGELVIASWGGDYSAATKEFLADPFEKETGIKVTIVDAPGTQIAQLEAQKKAGNVQWDILDGLGAADTYTLDAKGLLGTLTPEQRSSFAKELGDVAVSDFGITFANIGYIIGCTDKAVKCPATVKEFFDTENFPGTRGMPGITPSPVMSILAQAAGVELPADLEVLLDQLRAIKPSVKVFWTSGDQSDQVLRQGEVDMSIALSGRAFSLRDSGTPLTINWAGSYDPGFEALVADGPNTENARKFLDWLVFNPEAQANWAEAMGYSVPSAKALDLLPVDVREQFVDYPPNLQGLGLQDFPWYVENKEEIDKGFNSVIQGG